MAQVLRSLSAAPEKTIKLRLNTGEVIMTTATTIISKTESYTNTASDFVAANFPAVCNKPAFPTKKACQEWCDAESLTGILRKTIESQQSQARHTARVRATLEAALEAAFIARGSVPMGESEAVTTAYAILLLDLHGIGGPQGRGGPNGATVRYPGFRSLGKGRWQASDGPAYRAAGEEALRLLESIEPTAAVVSTASGLCACSQGRMWPLSVESQWAYSLCVDRALSALEAGDLFAAAEWSAQAAACQPPEVAPEEEEPEPASDYSTDYDEK